LRALFGSRTSRLTRPSSIEFRTGHQPPPPPPPRDEPPPKDERLDPADDHDDERPGTT
jgi:hypothetical protein